MTNSNILTSRLRTKQGRKGDQCMKGQTKPLENQPPFPHPKLTVSDIFCQCSPIYMKPDGISCFSLPHIRSTLAVAIPTYPNGTKQLNGLISGHFGVNVPISKTIETDWMGKTGRLERLGCVCRFFNIQSRSPSSHIPLGTSRIGD